MATINYTAEYSVAGGYVKVEWPGLAGGDVGQAFNCAGLKIGTVQHSGNFNGNTLSFECSNELSPANFLSVYTVTSAQFKTPDLADCPFFFGAVRPALGGSGGSVGVSAIFLLSPR